MFFSTKDARHIYPNPVSAGQLTVDVNNWQTVKKVQVSTANAPNRLRFGP